jgi:Helix-turn-helix domain
MISGTGKYELSQFSAPWRRKGLTMNKQTNNPTTPLLLGVQKAGEMLGLSPWTIRQWCYTGKIASYKMGTRLMVSQSEIDRILNDSLRPRLQDARP